MSAGRDARGVTASGGRATGGAIGSPRPVTRGESTMAVHNM